MSARGSANTENDSLELLLDTICNMFGGIVFISLLVVLMVQTNKGEFEEPNEIIDPHQIELLEVDLKLSRVQLDRVQQARQSQLALISKHVPIDLQEDMILLESLTNSRAEIENQVEKSRSDNLGQIKKLNLLRTKELKELKEQKKVNAELLSNINKTRQDIAILNQKHSQLLDAEGVQLPRAKRQGQSQNVQICICYNRLYFRHDPDKLQSGIRAPNLIDYLVISSDSSTIQIQPKPTAGISLSDKERARSLILSRLSNFTPRSWNISITLRPDSHGAFRMVREILAETGYHYSVYATGGKIADRGGSDRLSQ